MSTYSPISNRHFREAQTISEVSQPSKIARLSASLAFGQISYLVTETRRLLGTSSQDSPLVKQLGSMKQEKSELRKKIIEKEAAIHGKELASAQQTQEALNDTFGDANPDPPDLTKDLGELEQLRRQLAELDRVIAGLLEQLEQIQSGSRLEFRDSHQSSAFDKSDLGVATAFNNAPLGLQRATNLQLQFDAEKLYSQRLSRIQG